MGLFKKVSKRLPKQFSIFQMMSVLSMEASDHREARNILKQWAIMGLVTRLSQNMYEQVKPVGQEE
ncbi:MAG: hypothetical protein ACTSU5_04010 [Promethearchaeota archaeon]